MNAKKRKAAAKNSSLLKKLFFSKSKKKNELMLCVSLHGVELSIIVIKQSESASFVSAIIKDTLAADWFEDEKIKDDTQLAAHIKKLIHSYKIKAKKVIFISEDPSILPRLLTVPKRPNRWVANFILSELKKYVLFSGSKIKFNWKIIDTVESNGEEHYRVAAVAMKNQLYNRYSKLAKKAGLRLHGVSTHSLGLEHAISQLKFKKSQMIISIEPKQILTLYMNNGRLSTLHIDPISSDSIMNNPDSLKYLASILDRHKRNIPDCDLYYYCASWVPTKNDKLAAVMKQLSADPFNTQLLTENVKVSDTLTTPVDSYLAAVNASSMTYNDMLLVDKSTGSAYLNAFMKYFMIFVLVYAAILVGLLFMFKTNISSLEKDIKRIEKKLTQIDAEFAEVKTLDKHIATAKKLIVDRREIVKQNVDFDADHFFTTFPELMNSEVRLESFKLNDDKLMVLEGEAKGPDAVFTFLQQIKKSDYFINPELKEVIQNKIGESVHFIINSKLGEVHVE